MSITSELDRALESALDRLDRNRRKSKALIKEQIAKGTREELEHSKTIKRIKRNPKMPVKEAAALIAKDHIKEDPAYYERLKGIEKPKRRKGLKSPRIRLLMKLGFVRVYLVDATAVRKMTDKNPSSSDFTMGSNFAVWGQGFIPDGELWISDELGPPRDPLELLLTTLHESAETRRMTRDGLSYDDAHQESLELEEHYRSAKGRGLKAALKREARLWGRRLWGSSARSRGCQPPQVAPHNN